MNKNTRIAGYTVDSLIEALRKFPGEAPVVIDVGEEPAEGAPYTPAKVDTIIGISPMMIEPYANKNTNEPGAHIETFCQADGISSCGDGDICLAVRLRL